MSLKAQEKTLNDSTGRSTTRDGFFNGGFEVLQPDDGSHRAGLDALLLSACVPMDFSGKLADFGSGVGVAGMAVAFRSKLATVDLVEFDEDMAELAVSSQRLAANRGLHGRVQVICTDITLSGKERENAGLANGIYDQVIMNPPFNDPSHRPSPAGKRRAAHIMGEGGLDPWFRSAAATLKPNGRLAMIFRPSGLGIILASFQGRFGSTKIIPVHPRQDEPANRILVLATKGARGAVSILPGFVVHQKDGSFTPQATRIFKGEAVLPHIQSV